MPEWQRSLNIGAVDQCEIIQPLYTDAVVCLVLLTGFENGVIKNLLSHYILAPNDLRFTGNYVILLLFP